MAWARGSAEPVEVPLEPSEHDLKYTEAEVCVIRKIASKAAVEELKAELVAQSQVSNATGRQTRANLQTIHKGRPGVQQGLRRYLEKKPSCCGSCRRGWKRKRFAWQRCGELT